MPGGLGPVLQVNRTLNQQFGYGESELLGSQLDDLLDPGSVADMGRHVDALVAGDVAVAHDELRPRHRDGQCSSP